MAKSRQYRFSFGPWNIHEGGDPFGPTVREPLTFAQKLKLYKKLGFEGVQFHDDDAVPDLDKQPAAVTLKQATELGKLLKDEGLIPEFVAPRLWEHPKTIDGAYTANDPACRQYAIDRSVLAVDIAAALGCDLMVLWLARGHLHPRVQERPSGARMADAGH